MESSILIKTLLETGDIRTVIQEKLNRRNILDFEGQAWEDYETFIDAEYSDEKLSTKNKSKAFSDVFDVMKKKKYKSLDAMIKSGELHSILDKWTS